MEDTPNSEVYFGAGRGTLVPGEVGKGPRPRTSGPDGCRSSSSPGAMTLSSISILRLGSPLTIARDLLKTTMPGPQTIYIGISADGAIALGLLESSPSDSIRHR